MLDVARDTFQFVDARQHRELSRLREDRHICAHPAFVSPDQVFSPTAELTRLHLTVAVDAVLSLPPVPGKKALERFITDTKSQTWPRGHEDLKTYLKTNFLARGTASLKEGLAKVIVQGVMVPPDGDQTLSRRLADAAHALADAAPDLFVLALDAKVTRRLHGGSTIDSDALLRLVGGLGDLSQTWEALPGPIRAGILGAMSGATVRGLNEYGLFYRKLADPDSAVIIDQYLAGLDRWAGGEEELVAVLVDLPDASAARHLWPHALRMFAEAGSWRGAEKAMSGLIVPFASHLTAEDVDAVAHAVIANGQIMYAGGMPALMLYLFERAPRSPAHLTAWNWCEPPRD